MSFSSFFVHGKFGSDFVRTGFLPKAIGWSNHISFLAKLNPQKMMGSIWKAMPKLAQVKNNELFSHSHWIGWKDMLQGNHTYFMGKSMLPGFNSPTNAVTGMVGTPTCRNWSPSLRWGPPDTGFAGWMQQWIPAQRWNWTHFCVYKKQRWWCHQHKMWIKA